MTSPPQDRAAASASAAIFDLGRIAAILAPWLPDQGERDAIVGCILGEGAGRRRGASYALLALAGEIARRVGFEAQCEDRGIPVPCQDGPECPLLLDPGAMPRVAGGSAAAGRALSGAVTDGPPQHVLADVALLNLLTAILRRLEAGRGPA